MKFALFLCIDMFDYSTIIITRPKMFPLRSEIIFLMLSGNVMVLIVDGSSKHDAHLWSDLCNLICQRQLLTSTAVEI